MTIFVRIFVRILLSVFNESLVSVTSWIPWINSVAILDEVGILRSQGFVRTQNEVAVTNGCSRCSLNKNEKSDSSHIGFIII